MQSSDSCAQSQGLEWAHQPSRGVTTLHSVGKQQERKEGRWGGRKDETEPASRGKKKLVVESVLAIKEKSFYFILLRVNIFLFCWSEEKKGVLRHCCTFLVFFYLHQKKLGTTGKWRVTYGSCLDTVTITDEEIIGNVNGLLKNHQSNLIWCIYRHNPRAISNIWFLLAEDYVTQYLLHPCPSLLFSPLTSCVWSAGRGLHFGSDGSVLLPH